eukprot:4892673-Amphidinium_carterae.1
MFKAINDNVSSMSLRKHSDRVSYNQGLIGPGANGPFSEALLMRVCVCARACVFLLRIETSCSWHAKRTA